MHANGIQGKVSEAKSEGQMFSLRCNIILISLSSKATGVESQTLEKHLR